MFFNFTPVNNKFSTLHLSRLPATKFFFILLIFSATHLRVVAEVNFTSNVVCYGNSTMQVDDDLVHEIQITDVLGNVILTTEKITRSRNFNFSTLASGIYFLHIHQNGIEHTLNFSIER